MHGYNVGKLDGIIGKNTTNQLIKALKENESRIRWPSQALMECKFLKVAINKNIELKERVIGISRNNLESK
ncbi:MAG: hypothetical protein CM15mP58_23450 [Burkholderiaceae bacterium]|nr:MAG: hypothetical protein CM15mP58_23450 [Burkholderiaceae bacterium]